MLCLFRPAGLLLFSLYDQLVISYKRLPDKLAFILLMMNVQMQVKRLLGCACIFSLVTSKKNEKGLHRENNGILGSQRIDRPVGFLTINTTFSS